MKFMQSRLYAMQHAFSGIIHILRTQPNSWLHAIATILVVGLSIWLKISTLQWALIVLAIGLVWASEAFNTAIETSIDLITTSHHPLAKISKDSSAAAVLFSAITSAVIGILVLGPPLWLQLTSYLAK